MLTLQKLQSVDATGFEMHRLVEGFRDDMLPYASFSAQQIFDFLKNIPYRYDPDPVEFLQRPYYTVTRTGGGGDCDDKAVALASWATLNGIPYRFVAVGEYANEPPHHVFAEIQLNGRWIPMDCTYKFNVLGQPRPWKVRQEI